MTKKTLQAQYREALEKQGWFVPSKTTIVRGIVMMHSDGRLSNLYLGKNGSIRSGKTKATSVPMSEGEKRRLLLL